MKFMNILLTKIFILLAVVSVSTGAKAVEFDGLIEPYRVVKVGSAVAGVLETVNVDRGDFVREGQFLAALQSGVERAAVEVARVRTEMEGEMKGKKANLDFLTRKQSRNEQLFKEEVLPLSQMDEIETGRILAEMQHLEALENKRLAEQELKRAMEVVNRMSIHSPINGVVMERLLSPGEYVETQPILKLAEIDTLNVEVIIPVAQYASIKVGMRAKVIPEAPIGGQYIAEVKIVDRVIDAASGTFGVRLELPNPNHRLPAGLKCKVIFPGK